MALHQKVQKAGKWTGQILLLLLPVSMWGMQRPCGPLQIQKSQAKKMRDGQHLDKTIGQLPEKLSKLTASQSFVHQPLSYKMVSIDIDITENIKDVDEVLESSRLVFEPESVEEGFAVYKKTQELNGSELIETINCYVGKCIEILNQADNHRSTVCDKWDIEGVAIDQLRQYSCTIDQLCAQLQEASEKLYRKSLVDEKSELLKKVIRLIETPFTIDWIESVVADWVGEVAKYNEYEQKQIDKAKQQYQRGMGYKLLMNGLGLVFSIMSTNKECIQQCCVHSKKSGLVEQIKVLRQGYSRLMVALE